MAISAPAILFHQRFSRRPIVSLQNGRLGAEVSEFFLPTLRMALFRFGHAQKNAFAFLVPLALGQIAISLRRLDFRAPIAFDDFDCLRPVAICLRKIAVADLPSHETDFRCSYALNQLVLSRR